MKGWELGCNIEPLRESAATWAREQPALSQCLQDQHCAARILPEDQAAIGDWRIEPVVAWPGTLLRGKGKNSGTPSLKSWSLKPHGPHAAAGCQGFYQEHGYSASSKVYKRPTKGNALVGTLPWGRMPLHQVLMNSIFGPALSAFSPSSGPPSAAPMLLSNTTFAKCILNRTTTSLSLAGLLTFCPSPALTFP